MSNDTERQYETLGLAPPTIDELLDDDIELLDKRLRATQILAEQAREQWVRTGETEVTKAIELRQRDIDSVCQHRDDVLRAHRLGWLILADAIRDAGRGARKKAP